MMNRSILLVEDEPLIQLVLGEGLEDRGFQVLIKSDGQSALKELEANAAKFQLLLTDIRLGQGPSGWDVGRRARELVTAMPIIYMSGDSIADWSRYGVSSSVMLLKPLGVSQIESAVTTLLANNKAGF